MCQQKYFIFHSVNSNKRVTIIDCSCNIAALGSNSHVTWRLNYFALYNRIINTSSSRVDLLESDAASRT